MEQNLSYYNDPILRKKASPVTEITDAIRQIAQDLVDTLAKSKGIGLAAPQIHQSVRMFVIHLADEEEEENEEEKEASLAEEPKLFINPKLSDPSEETWTHDEGCLSIPGLYAPVTRPVSITVEATDLDGKTFSYRATGWEARVIMHENDHLNGVLFIDRIRGEERRALNARLKRIDEEHHPFSA